MNMMQKFTSQVSLTLCCMIISILSLHAQLVIKIIPPDLEELRKQNKCGLHLINPSTDSLHFHLLMNLEKDSGGVLYQAKSIYINMPPTQSINCKWDSIVSLIQEDKYNLPISKKEYHNNPCGLYRLCLYAIDSLSRKSIGNDCLQINIE